MPFFDPAHGADRDGHFLAAPEVTLLQEYVGHMMIVRCDDQPLHVSDLPVHRVHLLTAAHRHLAQRERVLRHSRCGVAGADDVAVGVVGHRHRLIGRVSGVTGPGQELDFLGDLEQFELGGRTAETNLAG